MPITPETIEVGDVCLRPEIVGGELRSLGTVELGGVPLRSKATRWTPWFDSYEGGVFNRFEFVEVTQRDGATVIRTRALCDNDYPFRERRDASGDLCFRNVNWDAPPLASTLDIWFEPAQAEVDKRHFSGFKYWFEYSGETPIHRLVDRATWEPGSTLEGNNLVCRNWLTPPRVRLSKDEEYSTVGLEKWAALLPGNLWARWSLLPAFDMQYGANGVLLGWFDEMSLIRTVIETANGEDVLRVLDMHLFEQSTQFKTNAKTILFSPDALDNTDALNLWTRVHDAEAEKARRQFHIPEESPPQLFLGCNVWQDFRFDSTYDEALDVAAEFGLDYIFIDSVFEHQRAFKEALDEVLPTEKQQGTIFEKFRHQNMCVTLDYEVADVHGGEAGLKSLCDRAAEKGVGVLSWMATHLSPNAATSDTIQSMDDGGFGVFAAKESGRHPDTGYPQSCWTMNLNTPIHEKWQEQMIGICQRTGLKGFLWDSFSNLGWWQLDYASGTMRPQFDKMTELYAAMRRANLHLLPEAIVAFSNHSCCGMHGGEIYGGDLLGYSYSSSISLWHDEYSHTNSPENRILQGKAPIDYLFRVLAHKRTPSLGFHLVPREKWDHASQLKIKNLLQTYKALRSRMLHRTVLKESAGVLWEDAKGRRFLWSFKTQEIPSLMTDGSNLIALCGAEDCENEHLGGRLEKNVVYEWK